MTKSPLLKYCVYKNMAKSPLSNLLINLSECFFIETKLHYFMIFKNNHVMPKKNKNLCYWTEAFFGCFLNNRRIKIVFKFSDEFFKKHISSRCMQCMVAYYTKVP